MDCEKRGPIMRCDFSLHLGLFFTWLFCSWTSTSGGRAFAVVSFETFSNISYIYILPNYFNQKICIQYPTKVVKIFHTLGSIHQRARWLTFSPACLYMYALTAGHYSTLRPANTIDHLRGFPSDSRYVRSRATARAPDRLNGLTLVAQKKRKKKKKTWMDDAAG